MKLLLLALWFIAVIVVKGSSYDSLGLQKTEKSSQLQNFLDTISLEEDVEILSRKGPCRILDGRCISKRRRCPNLKPVVTNGRKYCRKGRKCCHPGPCYPSKCVGLESGLSGSCYGPGNIVPTGKVVEDSAECTGNCECWVPIKDTDLLFDEESDEFALKHIDTGLYIQVWNGEQEQGLILQKTLTDMGKWKVIYRDRDTLPVHVQHVASGLYWHPHGGDDDPEEETIIVLYPSDPNYTLFQFNQATDIISHNLGKHLRPDPRDVGTPPGTTLRLYSSEDSAKFKAVHFSNTSEEFRIYGDAAVTAKWDLIYSLDTPALVEIDFELAIQIGYDKKVSSSDAVTFKWQVGAKAKFELASMSTSLSLQTAITNSNSETWSELITTKIQIKVKINETIAIWQRSFKAEQMGSHSLHKSNEYKNTLNSSIKPPDDADASDSYWI